MSQVTRSSWATSLLQSMQLPTTHQNTLIIVGWEAEEGGAGPQFGVAHNTANYNPLNTTQPEPGATTVNSAGVKSYSSWIQGMKATVTTLNNGDYTAIIDMLSSGTASSATAASVINGSKWGTRGLTAALIDCQKVVSGGLVIPTVQPGSAAGLGGSGLPGNQTATSSFYVGDSTNPDQDYWTTINQYCQEAQWYCFADGESLYVADAIELMAQTPALVIHRLDPKVVKLGFTWDNSSFNFAITRRARTGVQRRATLTRTTTPTQAQLQLICDIDEYRAGDTAYLMGCGPGDGIWLIGQCQRSIFEPFSTLTLIQGAMPLSALTGETIGPNIAPAQTASKLGSGTVIASMLAEATTIDHDNYPYVWGGGHARAGYPSVGSPGGPGYNGTTVGFDCSGAVGAVLAAAGVGVQWGQSVPSNDGIIQLLKSAGLLRPGQGSGRPEVTLFNNPGVHIYMRINGRYWGTAAGGKLPSNGYGVGWVFDGAPQAGFTAYHIPAGALRGYIAGTNALGAGG